MATMVKVRYLVKVRSYQNGIVDGSILYTKLATSVRSVDIFGYLPNGRPSNVGSVYYRWSTLYCKLYIGYTGMTVS